MLQCTSRRVSRPSSTLVTVTASLPCREFIATWARFGHGVVTTRAHEVALRTASHVPLALWLLRLHFVLPSLFSSPQLLIALLSSSHCLHSPRPPFLPHRPLLCGGGAPEQSAVQLIRCHWPAAHDPHEPAARGRSQQHEVGASSTRQEPAAPGRSQQHQVGASSTR